MFFSRGRSTRQRRQAPTRAKSPWQRWLCVEVLEDRTVPAAIIWTNPQGGDWDTPSNWSTHQVPGAADDVTVASTGAITHNAANTDAVHSLTITAPVQFAAGGLTIAAASVINGNVTLSGGVITGAGDLTVNGQLNWSGGLLSGGSAVTVTQGLNLNGGQAAYLSGRTLNNLASATLTQPLDVSAGAVINNLAGATWNLQAGAGVVSLDGTGRFNDYGVLTQPAGATSQLSWRYNAAGEVGSVTRTDSSGNTVVRTVTWTYAADTSLASIVEQDNNGDGSRVTREWDFEPNALTAFIEHDFAADGTQTRTVTASYYADASVAVVTATNFNSDGNTASVVTWNHADNGPLTSVQEQINNSDGSQTRLEWDFQAGVLATASENDLNAVGTRTRTVCWAYATGGQVTSATEKDFNADASVARTLTWTLNPDGSLAWVRRQDNNVDGSQTAREWDYSGGIVTIATLKDTSALGQTTRTVTWSYTSGGLLASVHEQINNADGSQTVLEWDDSAGILSSFTEKDFDIQGNLAQTVTWSYGSGGALDSVHARTNHNDGSQTASEWDFQSGTLSAAVEKDFDAHGNLTRLVHWTYDAQGNLTAVQEQDNHGDGSAAYLGWQYASGAVTFAVAISVASDGTGTYAEWDYQAAGVLAQEVDATFAVSTSQAQTVAWAMVGSEAQLVQAIGQPLTSLAVWNYNADGSLAWAQQQTNNPDGSQVDRHWDYAAGNLATAITVTILADNSGVGDEWTYSAGTRASISETDFAGGGAALRALNWVAQVTPGQYAAALQQATGTVAVAFNYDINGVLASIARSTADGDTTTSAQWNYRTDGSLASVSEVDSNADGSGQTMTWSFNADGSFATVTQKTTQDDDSTSTTEWDYQGGALTAVGTTALSASGIKTVSTWAYAGGVLTQAALTQTNADGSSVQQQWNFRPAGSLASVVATDTTSAGAATVYQWNYAADGTLTSQTESLVNGDGSQTGETWTYNADGSLAAVSQVTSSSAQTTDLEWTYTGGSLSAFSSTVTNADGSATRYVLQYQADGSTSSIEKILTGANGSKTDTQWSYANGAVAGVTETVTQTDGSRIVYVWTLEVDVWQVTVTAYDVHGLLLSIHGDFTGPPAVPAVTAAVAPAVPLVSAPVVGEAPTAPTPPTAPALPGAPIPTVSVPVVATLAPVAPVRPTLSWTMPLVDGAPLVPTPAKTPAEPNVIAPPAAPSPPDLPTLPPAQPAGWSPGPGQSDTIAPSSSVVALATYSPANFTVRWAGQDSGGSGLAFFDVYVADNNGPFVVWQRHTTQTTAPFAGVDGHTYAFYSVATDNAGNVQATPSAQASTTVDVTAPSSSVATLPAVSPTSFTLSWAGQDNPSGSGIANYDIYVSDNGGAYQLFLRGTTNTSATFAAAQPGHTYTFFSLARDKAGNVQTAAGPTAGTTIAFPATHLVVAAPAQAIAGAGLTVTVDAVNASGQVDAFFQGLGYLVLSSAPTGGTLTGTTTADFQNGVATFKHVTLNGHGGAPLAAPASFTLFAATDADLSSNTAAITVTTTTHFGVGVSVAQVAGVIAGTPQTVTVTAYSAQNTVDTNYRGTIHFTSTDQQAGLPADYTFAPGDFGRHVFTLGSPTPGITLKTAGKQTVTVVDVTKATARGMSAAVNVLPAPLAALSVSGIPNPATSGTSYSVTVQAVDAYGNVVPGYQGLVSFNATGGTVTGLPATGYQFTAADNSSHTFTGVRLGATANAVITLTAADLANHLAGAEANIVVLSPTKMLDVTGPAPLQPGQATVLQAGTPFTVTVVPRLINGQIDPNFRDTIHFSSSDPHAMLPCDYTFDAGDGLGCSFTVCLEQAGATVTVTDMTRPAVLGGSPDVTIVPGSVARFAVSGYANPTTSGAAHGFTVTAVDAGGNTVTNYAGTIHLSSSDSLAQGLPPLATGYTFLPGKDHGVHTFTGVTLLTPGVQSIDVTDGTWSGSEAGIQVLSAATSLTATASPSTVVAGTPFQVTVSAGTDLHFGDKIHFSSTDPNAVLPADYQFRQSDHGSHTFTGVVLQKAGATITITDLTRPVVPAVSPRLTVVAGSPGYLRVSGIPTTAVVGSTYSLVLAGVDSYGNVVTNFQGTVNLQSTGVAITGLPASYQFTGADRGQHTFTNVRFNGAGSWQFAALDQGLSGSAQSTIVQLTAGVSGPSVAVPGQPLIYTLTASETGAASTAVYRWNIDWNGDGRVDQSITGASGTAVTHVFTAAGKNAVIVQATAADALGNTSPQAGALSVRVVQAALEADPLDATKNVLVVGGSVGRDTITLRPAGASGQSVMVQVNGVAVGVFASGATQAASGPLGHILVYGQGGGDTIQLLAAAGNPGLKLAVPAILFAGGGNATLSAAGSSANNVLVGGAGNDVLIGGSGRDILIGGSGADVLHAGSGGDILIACRTAYDSDVVALLALAAEWGRNASYQTRVQDLFGSGGGGLNGGVLLNAQALFADPAVNQLFGTGGASDWFWLARGVDKLSGAASGDTGSLE